MQFTFSFFWDGREWKGHLGNFDCTYFSPSLFSLGCNQPFNILNEPYYLKIHRIFAFNDLRQGVLSDVGFIKGRFEKIYREVYVESLRIALEGISLCCFCYWSKIYSEEI